MIQRIYLSIFILAVFFISGHAFFPVVYVIFGEIPMFLKINIELAARNNPVVVLTDSRNDIGKNFSLFGIQYVNVHDYSKAANDFAPHYKHMSRDHSPGRQHHELRCIQRWFILKEYMGKNNVERAFFGDGDSSVFVNISEIFNLRPQCGSVINVEAQGQIFHWVGAGESSIWTFPAIKEFCEFTQTVYSHHISVLELKGRGGSSVVDMSIIWLWWVAHKKHSPAGWETGRPYNVWKKDADENFKNDLRERSDTAFNYSAKLDLPSIDMSIQVCNGLDVINRTVFDHMHGWQSGSNFTLNIEEGRPYLTGASLIWGGVPESLEVEELKILESSRLYLNNLHYQGNAKRFLEYDVCRILLYSRSETISNPAVLQHCKAEAAKHPGLGCQMHPDPNDQMNICA